MKLAGGARAVKAAEADGFAARNAGTSGRCSEGRANKKGRDYKGVQGARE